MKRDTVSSLNLAHSSHITTSSRGERGKRRKVENSIMAETKWMRVMVKKAKGDSLLGNRICIFRIKRMFLIKR